ncbi:DJ-1/PfpI/YhbO family deglycase/protease [Saccharopolyspora sp. CA-218241]|uniref:DJ-1/PfpI/YhbO family deglycase/protease n=1 Tax=Saccharopolyspora sp. CA-218241 TaxID=3240027 RepID=UPI003D96EA75
MADADVTGGRVLAVVSNHGVEQDELVVPVNHLRERGALVDVCAITGDPVRTLVGDQDPGQVVEPSNELASVDPGAYDLLLVPGGTLNADALRQQARAVEIARSFARTGRIIASICHGPWLLVEAGVLDGKNATSYASLATDIRNAGGQWGDDAVVRDDAAGWTLITSRGPDDLPDFLREVEAALGAATA